MLNGRTYASVTHVKVPGGYQDSLSKNTKLGRAVDDACSELSHLGELVRSKFEHVSAPEAYDPNLRTFLHCLDLSRKL